MTRIKVKMVPHINDAGSESGIRTVIKKYFQHLPKYGVELVSPGATSYDLVAAHAGMVGGEAQISHLHGLYWSADYNAAEWEWRVNARIVESIRGAKVVTVPSDWVAETLRRDCRINPVVVPHGIDWQEWQHNEPNEGYVIGYAKNRAGADVCDPNFLTQLSKRFPKVTFTTTFAPKERPTNVKIAEVMPHEYFKTFVQRAAVYISPVKETFGLGSLEALAAGVPVLGWANGGNLQLISHGVNGYLAEPGNLDDLYTGLAYCLKHRDVLGANGREMAKQWTWENACRILVGVYERALQPEPPTVSVIVPVYNKPMEQVKRAVQSALDQTYEPVEVIVVNDGSDQSYQEVARLGKQVKYIEQSNQGVANARNNGITATNAKYITCLDSDDFLEPTFLQACVDALESDRSLGIAYTGLRWHNPDGKTGISTWPPDFNYDAQLARRNQIPTCCVFRREAWQRTGGYRSRYCPNGAGSEDAAFWTAIGAIGYSAKKVTDEPLFNYSAGSGQVNGNPSYSEVDWLGMYPWVKDGLHPFASIATPKRYSHPVHQYDEPVISVIIPVGPGHEKEVINALDSLESQHFRRWEVIISWDTGDSVKDEFTLPDGARAGTHDYSEAQKFIHRAYPYVRSVSTATVKGAGAARNIAVSIARSPFLFFLDADDVLADPDALDKMLKAWKRTQSIIYSDYLGKATWEDYKQARNDLKDRLLGYNSKTHQAIIRHYSADYDCPKAQRQPELDVNNPKMPYYLWCLVSVLVPKAWHDAIGGFDEKMETWEDVEYFWRLARAGYCFYRIREPLLLYKFDTGNRRQASIPRDSTGRQKHENMINYIKSKETKSMGCNCGGNKRTPVATVTAEAVSAMNDDQFVMIEFHFPGEESRSVYGSPLKSFTRQTINGRLIDYGGYARQSGDRFLVHRADQQARPDMFRLVHEVKAEPPRVEIKEPEPPKLVAPVEESKPEKEAKPARAGRRRR